MMKKRYIVVPGLIRGMLISAHQLTVLFYEVDPRECLMPSRVTTKGSTFKKTSVHLEYDGALDITLSEQRSLVPLRPQEEGDYSLEKAKVDFIREKLIG